MVFPVFWVAPFFPLFVVGAPPKIVFPEKRPLFSRVIEQPSETFFSPARKPFRAASAEDAVRLFQAVHLGDP